MLFAIWLALVVLAASVASAGAAPPQPDAAPEAPAVAPDPAPGAAQDAPASANEPAPAPPAAPPAATTQPAASAPAQRASASEPRQQTRRSAGQHHRTSTQARRADGAVEGARASSMLRIRALLPGDQTTAHSSSTMLMLAAGALLALVLASGSMVSVASRAMKGQLR
jgi:type IV secretory pathway VirB10-like protein